MSIYCFVLHTHTFFSPLLFCFENLLMDKPAKKRFWWIIIIIRNKPPPSLIVFLFTFPQNYLRVALQELDSGCTAKTLQVRPYATIEEVCQLCAQKFKVSDPQNYGLFLLMEGSSQQLAPDTYPQKIKAELHSRPQAAPFHFVFRRVANSSTLSTAPFDAMPNLNELSMDLSDSSPQPQRRSRLCPAPILSLTGGQLEVWTGALSPCCEDITHNL